LGLGCEGRGQGNDGAGGAESEHHAGAAGTDGAGGGVRSGVRSGSVGAVAGGSGDGAGGAGGLEETVYGEEMIALLSPLSGVANSLDDIFRHFSYLQWCDYVLAHDVSDRDVQRL
jgi:hypothetical protein